VLLVLPVELSSGLFRGLGSAASLAEFEVELDAGVGIIEHDGLIISIILERVLRSSVPVCFFPLNRV